MAIDLDKLIAQTRRWSTPVMRHAIRGQHPAPSALDQLIARTAPTSSLTPLQPWMKAGPRLLEMIVQFRGPVTRTLHGTKITVDHVAWGAFEGVEYVSDGFMLLPSAMAAATKAKAQRKDQRQLGAVVPLMSTMLPARVVGVGASAFGDVATLLPADPERVRRARHATEAGQVIVSALRLASAVGAVGTPARLYVSLAGGTSKVNPLGVVRVEGPRGFALVMPFKTKD